MQYFQLRLSQSIRFVLFFSFLFGNFSFTPPAAFPSEQQVRASDIPNPLRAEVIAIQDGDTMEMKFIYSGKKAGRRMGKPLRIRFLHINCPERGRPFYNNAKQYTAKSCFRKTVQIRHKGEFDKYGRLLGEVILPDGRNLNKELVKNGLAVHFKKYSKDAEYARLENVAKKQRIGIWSIPNTFLGQL